MKIVIRIVLGLVALVAVLAVVGLMLPGHYKVTRTVEIQAPASAVFEQINTLKHWPEWTAWTVKKYPDMQVAFTGPEAGVGAKYKWEGKTSGKGELELTQSETDKLVAYNLNFEDGQCLAAGSITIEPAGQGIKVSWSNEGDLGWNPVNRYFGLMMDSMMGPDFQEGLENLKKKVEPSSK